MPLPPEPVMNMRELLGVEAFDLGLEALAGTPAPSPAAWCRAAGSRCQRISSVAASMTTAFTVVEPTSMPIRKCFSMRGPI